MNIVPQGGSVSFLLFFSLLIACNTTPDVATTDPAAGMQEKITTEVERMTGYALEHYGRIADTTHLAQDSLVADCYRELNFKPVWSDSLRFKKVADSMFAFIEQAWQYGLFPADYHFDQLAILRKQTLADSVQRLKAVNWAKADLMLTDAFLQISKDLKQGRLPNDSMTLNADSLYTAAFYTQQLQQALQTGAVAATLQELEPRVNGYQSLKKALVNFLPTARLMHYTQLSYPIKDSVAFNKALQRRLWEERKITSATDSLSTEQWETVISNYQAQQGLKVTGKINSATVNKLNDTDWEKFKRIAINLDRYKKLPDTMPEVYLWVNLPAYRLDVMEDDTVALTSAVIVGQPRTPTPLINSRITDFITYPQWTVPYSIVFREMLPKIKKDIHYLDKENLMIVDKNDSVIDPATIDWSRMNKFYFPYLIRQRQGDDNSLGVMKFNFYNKYSVYLHDTNARWLFGQSARALSHGCVRVKDWKKLADFLVRDDTLRYHPDTLNAWIKRQEKHVVYGFAKVPIYIRYFTAEGREGRVRFYSDIYGEDKLINDRYFAAKNLN